MLILPLLRFHLAVGARLAMRVFVPAITAAVGGGMLLGSYFLTSLSNMLFGPRSAGGSAVLVAACCLSAAAVAAPRVCRGLHGWLRHLPIDGLAHRRAAGLAVAVAQSPLLILFLFLAAFASRSPATLVVDGLGLVVTALGAAVAVTPSERWWLARVPALAAAVVAGSGGWGMLGVGAGLIVLADFAAGPLARLAPKSGRPVAHLSRRTGGRFLEPRIAWRALGGSILGAYAVGLLPVGAAWAFLAHNTLSPEHAHLGARLGAGCAAVLLLAQLGESLAVRRPAWPWSRSLPWSAARRVGADALFLGLHALPLVLMTAWIEPAALAVLGLLPFLSVRASGAMRRAPERRTGTSGEILLEGLLLAALAALLPWTAVLALAAMPFALWTAAERERRQKVSRWLELHHLAAGDPQSWSAS
jgi:hypothetical protein